MKKVLGKVLCSLLALCLIAVPVVPAKAAENVNTKNMNIGDRFVAEKCSASSFRVVSGDQSVITKKEVEVNHDWALEFTAVKNGTVTFEVEQEIKYDWTRVTYTVNVGGDSEVKPSPEPTYPTEKVDLNINEAKTIANIKTVKDNSDKSVASAAVKKTGRGKRAKFNLVIKALAEGETDITVLTKAGDTKIFHVVVTDPEKPVIPDVPVEPEDGKIRKSLKVGEYFDIEEAYKSGFTCISGDESILEKSLVEVNSHNNLRLTAVKEGKVEFTQKHEVKGDWVTTTYVVTVEGKATPDVDPQPAPQPEPEPEVPDVKPEPQPEPSVPAEEVKLNIYDNTKIADVEKIISNSASDVVEARIVKSGRWYSKKSNLVLEGLKAGEADVTVVMKDGTDKNFHVVVIDPNAAKPDETPDVKPDIKPDDTEKPDVNTVVKNIKVGESFEMEKCNLNSLKVISGNPSSYKMEEVEIKWDWGYKFTALEEGTVKFTVEQEINWEWTPMTYVVNITK